MTLSDKKILKDVINCNSSKENAHNVVDWFASTVEGHQELSDMIDLDAYLIEQDSTTNNQISSTKSQEIFDKIDSQIKHNKIKSAVWRIAAIFIPFILLLALGVYINNSFSIIGKTTYTELYIPNGEKAHIIFQDGSEAILNSSTKIKFPKKFGLLKREVELEGEAYFKVNHNKHRPFFIKTDKSLIKVLGTSFNVSSYSDDNNIDITLDEGVIEFSTSKNKHRLSPGQQLSFNKSNSESSIINLKYPENNSLWTSNILYFVDTPLNKMISVLERKFDITFEIKDKQALDYTFTITTEAKSIEAILSELELITPIRFNLKDGIYEISPF